jgi:Ca-activated chloride channel family protein
VIRSILLLACVLIARSAGAQALQTATETAHTGTTATSTASAPATTPPAPTASSQATFRSNIDIVALNVVVTDSDQKYVSGLRPSDFAVFEDGIQQDVSFFGESDVPLDLAILLDTSASMTGKMQLVQQAAIGFLKTLRTGDRAIVVDIKDATKIMYPLGDDMDAAKQAILSTSPRGGTALYNGTYLTLKEMVKERRGNGEVRRQALVVLSGRRRTRPAWCHMTT